MIRHNILVKEVEQVPCYADRKMVISRKLVDPLATMMIFITVVTRPYFKSGSRAHACLQLYKIKFVTADLLIHVVSMLLWVLLVIIPHFTIVLKVLPEWCSVVMLTVKLGHAEQLVTTLRSTNAAEVMI